MLPRLYVIVPCYNEEDVLPITAPEFLAKLDQLSKQGKISDDSRILFVNDGSKDRTWQIITELAENNSHYIGISQSRNRGHQNAVLAGLMEAKDSCDITISIDCDGQDDLNAMDRMIDAYAEGCEVVYGVRSDRTSDSFFKRTTAQAFYRLLAGMGVEVIYNHADYRLLGKRVLNALKDYREVNLFLRGLVPLIGFKSTVVEYSRSERIAGKSHYPLKKMLSLAVDGITGLSVKPLHMIFFGGMVFALTGIAGLIAFFILEIKLGCVLCAMAFFTGLLMICIGVLGEYLGKVYLEVKARPRYIISERTNNQKYEEKSNQTDSI